MKSLLWIIKRQDFSLQAQVSVKRVEGLILLSQPDETEKIAVFGKIFVNIEVL